MRRALAKRYAQAIFSLGIDESSWEGYGQELADFWASVQGAGPDGEALYSLAYPREIRGQALTAVLAKAALSPTVEKFLRLLSSRGRLSLLGEINAAYQRLGDERKGLIRGVVTSAGPLNDSQLAAIKSALGTFIGHQVELTVKEDPTIIGGLIAKLGDLVVDGSLRTKLDQLGRLLGAA
ncbi:MAG: ATP synthase F1 subunit delta [Deltaproteobacteria bacterium]|jgi:F-type H+-transporting ATPase subunit delta|nr:ATP synthase F1 subunit delta [Deltaproteobacteria bacterium]